MFFVVRIKLKYFAVPNMTPQAWPGTGLTTLSGSYNLKPLQYI